MQATGKHDWGLILSGIAIALIGLIVVMWPGLSLATLSIMAGIMFLVAGVVDVIGYIRTRKEIKVSGWALVNAICDIVLGALFLLYPATGAFVITWVAGAFVIAYGIFAIMGAFALRGTGISWGWMLFSGIMGIICGAMFFLTPEFFALFLGFFLMVRGVTLAVYGVTAPTAIHGGLFQV